MKCILILSLLSYAALNANAYSLTAGENVAVAPQAQEQQTAASEVDVLTAQAEDKKQEKRYVGYNGYGGLGGYGGYGGYGGVGGSGYGGYAGGLDSGYYNPYNRLGLDGSGYTGAGYTGVGYTGGAGYAGAGGYYGGLASGNYYGSGLNNPLLYTNPYLYYSRLGAGFPYNRGYNGYPTSNYYGGNYGSSIVGGGLGGLTPAPITGAGYQYGPGISGTVY